MSLTDFRSQGLILISAKRGIALAPPISRHLLIRPSDGLDMDLGKSTSNYCTQCFAIWPSSNIFWLPNSSRSVRCRR